MKSEKYHQIYVKLWTYCNWIHHPSKLIPTTSTKSSINNTVVAHHPTAWHQRLQLQENHLKIMMMLVQKVCIWYYFGYCYYLGQLQLIRIGQSDIIYHNIIPYRMSMKVLADHVVIVIIITRHYPSNKKIISLLANELKIVSPLQTKLVAWNAWYQATWLIFIS